MHIKNKIKTKNSKWFVKFIEYFVVFFSVNEIFVNKMEMNNKKKPIILNHLIHEYIFFFVCVCVCLGFYERDFFWIEWHAPIALHCQTEEEEEEKIGKSALYLMLSLPSLL